MEALPNELLARIVGTLPTLSDLMAISQAGVRRLSNVSKEQLKKLSVITDYDLERHSVKDISDFFLENDLKPKELTFDFGGKVLLTNRLADLIQDLSTSMTHVKTISVKNAVIFPHDDKSKFYLGNQGHNFFKLKTEEIGDLDCFGCFFNTNFITLNIEDDCLDLFMPKDRNNNLEHAMRVFQTVMVIFLRTLAESKVSQCSFTASLAASEFVPMLEPMLDRVGGRFACLCYPEGLTRVTPVTKTTWGDSKRIIVAFERFTQEKEMEGISED